MKVVLTALVSALVFTGFGYAAERGVTLRQFRALQARVATLESLEGQDAATINKMNSKVACLSQAMPVSTYKNYLMSDGSGIAQFDHIFLTTALNITFQGQTPQAWVATVPQSCIGSTLKAVR